LTREKGEFDARIKYGERLPLGAADAKERIERLDLEGLDAAIIYPSLELTWENRVRRRGLCAGDVPSVQPLDY